MFLQQELHLNRAFVCVVISFFRGVWLSDGGAADSGGVCSQSCCQDYEEWVDSKSTQLSPQWIPSCREHRPFERQCTPRVKKLCWMQEISLFDQKMDKDTACKRHWQKTELTPNLLWCQSKDNCMKAPKWRGKDEFWTEWGLGGKTEPAFSVRFLFQTVVKKFKQTWWLKLLPCINSEFNKPMSQNVLSAWHPLSVLCLAHLSTPLLCPLSSCHLYPFRDGRFSPWGCLHEGVWPPQCHEASRWGAACWVYQRLVYLFLLNHEFHMG